MATVGRDVLSRVTFKRITVDVPEWGGEAWIREMSSAEVARVQQIAIAAVDVVTRTVTDVTALARFQAMVVVAGWIDAEGHNCLTETDVDLVLGQPSKVVALLSSEICKLSGIEPISDVKAQVEEAKND